MTERWKVRDTATVSMSFALVLFVLVGPVGLSVASAAPLPAGGTSDDEEGQEESVDTGTLGGFRLDGEMLFGYRLVNQGGHQPKYREDIDLEEGGRLLSGRMVLLPAGDREAGWFDRIEISGAGLGGDPYQAWGVEVRKAESYRLTARGRQSDYFQALTGELHSWDTRRNHTDVDLRLTPGDNLELWGKFARFSKTGSRVTSRDISREEFLFDEPLDQSADTWAVGARYRFDATRVWLEQSFRNFDDNGGFGVRGLDQGLTPDEAYLTFLEQREVRTSDTPITRGGLSTRFGDDRFRVDADFLTSDQSLDFSFSRIWEGGDFRELPFREEIAATGAVERRVRHGNAALLWDATDAVTASVRYRRRSWDQDGSNFVQTEQELTDPGTISLDSRNGVTSYRVELDQFTLGAEVAPSRTLAVFAELGITRRDQRFEFDDDDAHPGQTDTTAYRFGFRLRPPGIFDMSASFARDDIDDPYTRVSPTEAETLKVRARLRPGGRWQLVGNLTARNLDNVISRVDLNTLSWGGTVTYRGGEERWIMAGYSRLDHDSSVPIVYRPFFAGRAEDVADSRVASNVITVAAEYRAGTSPVTLLGRASYVTTEGELPTGGLAARLRSGNRHDIDYGDWSLGLRYLFDHGLYAHAMGRFVTYDEVSALASDGDDYNVSLVTVGFGLRF